MDKKSNNELTKHSDLFYTYLKDKLPNSVFQFLNEISKETEIYIFSGIIRNYFIKYKGPIRDIDVVTSDFNERIKRIIEKNNFQLNRFGGYKLNLDGLPIDMWDLKNTWAFSNNKIELTLFGQFNLPDTTFFNFSSAIYSLNKKEFIYNREFENFVKTKKIDLVLKENPAPDLCIINTVYYKEKYHLDVANSLKKYYLENFNNYSELDYLKVQEKHFGKIEYSYPYLKEYYRIFNREFAGKSE